MTKETITTTGYDENETTRLLELWNERKERAENSADDRKAVVEEIATTMAKSVKSVIGKLNRMGQYKALPAAGKNGQPAVKKADLAAKVAARLGLSEHDALSLEKPTKNALLALVQHLEQNDD